MWLNIVSSLNDLSDVLHSHSKFYNVMSVLQWIVGN